MEHTWLLVLEASKYVFENWKWYLFPEILTQLLKTVHWPCCYYFHIGPLVLQFCNTRYIIISLVSISSIALLRCTLYTSCLVLHFSSTQLIQNSKFLFLYSVWYQLLPTISHLASHTKRSRFLFFVFCVISIFSCNFIQIVETLTLEGNLWNSVAKQKKSLGKENCQIKEEAEKQDMSHGLQYGQSYEAKRIAMSSRRSKHKEIKIIITSETDMILHVLTR